MCPVIHHLQNYAHEIETRVAVTGQHRSMLDQILEIFNVSLDYDLDIMQQKIIEYAEKSEMEKWHCQAQLRFITCERFDIEHTKVQIRQLIAELQSNRRN
jgi:hypothetical protein